MRLLLVEDDAILGKGISDAFTLQGDSVEWLQDGYLGLQALVHNHFDLLILDLGLPELDGIQLLTRARSQGVQTPVLILTARDQTADKVLGLDAGADDYIVKPFDMSELNARVRAITRRQNGLSSAKLDYGTIIVDLSARQVSQDGIQVSLSRREYALLVELLSNTGKVLTRERLTDQLYGWGDGVESNTLEVHIHHLRKKLSTLTIHTIRGIGYQLEPLP